MVVILQVLTTKVCKWKTLKQNSEYGSKYVDGRLRYTTMEMDKILSNGKQKFVDDRLQNFQMGNKQQKFEDGRLKYMMHRHVD